MSAGARAWWAAAAYAVPIVAGLIGLFYHWYAVRDRYFIFLYYHDMGPGFDGSPFGWVTLGRYRMSGLVASGAVMVPYVVLNLVLGRLAGRCRATPWRGVWPRPRVRDSGEQGEKGYRAPAWWRVWVLCAVPLAVAVPAILMRVNRPVMPASVAAQVTAVLLAGLALALSLGRLAAERPLAYLLASIDGGAFAVLLVALTLFEQYPGWLARGRAVLTWMHLFVVGVALTLLAAMTVLYALWRRAHAPGASTMLVAGLNLAYLLVPLIHHLFFSTDQGTWLDPGYFTYIPSADNYFARSAAIQVGVWAIVTSIALGVTRLRVRFASHRAQAAREEP